MSVTVNKTTTDPYDIESLQSEVNADGSIVPACMSVSASDDDLTLEFTAALSGAEDTALDAVIAAHVPPVESIDVAQLPLSAIDGIKISVHPSYKPTTVGTENYAVWTGAGDEVDASSGNLVDGGIIGGGPLLCLEMSASVSEVSKDVKFHSDNGSIWLHEAYIKFSNASPGDYIIGDIRAEATPLQTSVNKDLEVNGSNWIVFASAGAGNGTHGWADASKIVLIPRTFSKDGDWNFDGVNLTPNASAAGGYKISDIEQIAHRYVNKIPCSGTVPYFSITSDETSLLPPNYYVRITCKTEDGGNFAQAWGLCVLLEIYRQRTHNP